MALTFNHLPQNHVTYASNAAVWVSTDNGATWTRLSNSAELTFTPETSESEMVDNMGAGNFDDALKNYIIEAKFMETGEDVRQVWTDDSDQDMRGKEYALWVQGAKLAASGGTATYEQHVFYRAKLKRNHGPYAIGGSERVYTFTFYARRNTSCAAVVITAPTGDSCYKGSASLTATINHGEAATTMDSVAS
jgi:hypothetical protein